MDRHEGELSRRAFLIRTSLVSLGALAAGTLPARTAHAETGTPMPPHGADLRGTNLPLLDPNAEGRFGYMLKGLPPYTLPDDVDPLGPPTAPFDVAKNPLRALGSKMLEPSPLVPGTETDQHDENDRWNENPNEMMTSGVTFLSQFVDHDITLDLTTLENQLADPDAMTDFRTPRYDLDAIYGLGPNDTTPGFYHRNLYDPNDRDKFLLINRNTSANPVWDVPRYGVDAPTFPQLYADGDHPPAGTAVISDRRNDQTLLVLQVHVAFLKFHNALVDYSRRLRVPSSGVFEFARRYTRWHYQWVVIQDLLKRLVNVNDPQHPELDLIGPKGSVYREVVRKAPVITLNFYKPQNRNARAFMPLEFSVAAFRFGHSLARPRYTVNETLGFGTVKGIPLFADDTIALDAKLNGGRPIPPRLKVQWSRFFNDIDPMTKVRLKTSKRTRQIDSRLSMPLFSLPASARPDANPQALLGVRNLLRGQQLKLPSGQEVARRMGVTPLTNAQLARRYTIKLDKTTFAILVPGSEGDDAELGPIITHPAFNGEAPLWFYILKEAELIGKTERLGPVGGRLVAEVLVGLLQRDPNSYLYLQPDWKPILPTNAKGEFGIVELLKYAGVWS